MSETSVPQKKRMIEQDIAKGLAILLVVFVHSVELKSTAMDWLVATTGYAMPFFFFISGYNYRSGRGSWWKNIAKRAKQILWPLLYYSVCIYVVMTIYFIIRDEATVTDALRSFGSFWLTRPLSKWVGISTEMGSPFSSLLVQGWFLQHMMTAYIIFYLVADYALKSFRRLISICIGLLSVTCVFVYFEVTLPWGIHSAPLIAAMMLAGAMFGSEKLLHKETVPVKWVIANTLGAFGIYLILGLLYPRAGQFAAGSLGHNIGFWDVFVTFLAAILGTYILVSISKVLEKVPLLNKVLIWFGTNSLTILLLHTSFIKIFSNAFNIQKRPMGQKIEQTNWWTVLVYILSIIATAALILLINYVTKRLKNKEKNHEAA